MRFALSLGSESESIREVRVDNMGNMVWVGGIDKGFVGGMAQNNA